MTRTEMELRNRIEAAGFKAITVTMKCNGDEVVITPCLYGDKKSFDEVEYYLVDSPSVNLYGSDNLGKVAETLVNYGDLLKKMDADIMSLKAHINKYGEKSDWDFVSDYHKDLFGHRPHVAHSQIIAWAKSDSMNSARHYEGRLADGLERVEKRRRGGYYN